MSAFTPASEVILRHSDELPPATYCSPATCRMTCPPSWRPRRAACTLSSTITGRTSAVASVNGSVRAGGRCGRRSRLRHAGLFLAEEQTGSAVPAAKPAVAAAAGCDILSSVKTAAACAAPKACWRTGRRWRRSTARALRLSRPADAAGQL